jgi:hypothetical protein
VIEGAELRIERGRPDDVELAALVVALSLLTAQPPDTEDGPELGEFHG